MSSCWYAYLAKVAETDIIKTAAQVTAAFFIGGGEAAAAFPWTRRKKSPTQKSYHIEISDKQFKRRLWEQQKWRPGKLAIQRNERESFAFVCNSNVETSKKTPFNRSVRYFVAFFCHFSTWFNQNISVVQWHFDAACGLRWIVCFPWISQGNYSIWFIFCFYCRAVCFLWQANLFCMFIAYWAFIAKI